MRPILLDTCALIWMAGEGRLSPSAEAELDTADTVAVSPISAWEIGQLTSRGRLSLSLEPRDWFQQALGVGLVLLEMPPELLIASSFLPGPPLRDPADRIVAATARAFQYRLMTRDRSLLEYGAAGHLETVAC